MRFLQFLTIDGRIGRGGWWAMMLTAWAVPWSPFLIEGLVSGQAPGLGSLVLAGAVGFWVALCAICKRLHDLDKPAILIVLALVPFVAIFFMIWLGFFPGTSGPNSYGDRQSGSPFARIEENPAFV